MSVQRSEGRGRAGRGGVGWGGAGGQGGGITFIIFCSQNTLPYPAAVLLYNNPTASKAEVHSTN